MRPSNMTRGALAGLLLFLVTSMAWPGSSEQEVIAVVVAPDGPKQPMDKDTLANIFLRKKTLWSNQDAIRPVNLSASHPLRRLFSQRVLGLEPEELDNYWNDQYFQGIFPPYSVASEEAALRYVTGSPDAIGYVSACAVDKRVKVLFFLTPTGLVPSGNLPRYCQSQLR